MGGGSGGGSGGGIGGGSGGGIGGGSGGGIGGGSGGGGASDAGAQADLTLACWNLEWFGDLANGPADDAVQFANVHTVLADAGMVDLWALEEVVSSSKFEDLKSLMVGFDGFLSNNSLRVSQGSTWYSDGEQKLGVLFRSDRLAVLNASVILTAFASDFAGRPPLRVDFRVAKTGTSLTVIVLHMKAFAKVEDYQQRLAAGAALKSYLDALGDIAFLVVGDWNDDVDRSIVKQDGGYLPSPYEAFLGADAGYVFVTRPLSLAGHRSTTTGSQMIDHHLAANSAVGMVVADTAAVMRPDQWGIASYATTTTDHYPVVSRYCTGCTQGSTPTTSLVFLNEVLEHEPRDLPLADGGYGPDYAKEFVELVNQGPGAADLSGWTLSDSSAIRHVFASGTILGPGHAVVVFGGASGIPPGLSNAVASSTRALALHPADRVELRAFDGGLVDSLAWLSTTPDPESRNRVPDGQPGGAFALHTSINPSRSSSPGLRSDGGAFP